MDEQVFPDTAEGARAALKKIANRSTYRKLRNLDFIADEMRGVWRVRDGSRPAAVIYLAGYDGRKTSDFETADWV